MHSNMNVKFKSRYDSFVAWSVEKCDINERFGHFLPMLLSEVVSPTAIGWVGAVYLLRYAWRR
jgi:hypothetical protein